MSSPESFRYLLPGRPSSRPDDIRRKRKAIVPARFPEPAPPVLTAGRDDDYWKSVMSGFERRFAQGTDPGRVIMSGGAPVEPPPEKRNRANSPWCRHEDGRVWK